MTPKTDWSDTDSCTHDDMNRIAGNINILCGTSLKEDYTQDDVVSLVQWSAILAALRAFAGQWDFDIEDEPTEDATAANFNTVESLTLALKEWYDMIHHQSAAYVYVGEDLFAGDEKYLRKAT